MKIRILEIGNQNFEELKKKWSLKKNIRKRNL